jgi:ribosome biogenesis GTPase
MIEDPLPYIERIRASAPGITVYSASSLKGVGLENIRKHLGSGKTGVLIGSSGTGKSTILNALAGGNLRKTQAVRDSDSRGRHTTSLRELFLIPDTGCIIDSPGIREAGMWTGRDGLDSAFSDITAEIAALSEQCRFSDCAHEGEPGCGVSEALAEGRLSRERFEHYLKLKREMEFAASRANDRIRRDREKKWKDIAKKTRHLKKEKRR